MIIKRHIPNEKAREFETSLKEMIEINSLNEQCITWIQKGDKTTVFELEVFRNSDIEIINLMEGLL